MFKHIKKAIEAWKGLFEGKSKIDFSKDFLLPIEEANNIIQTTKQEKEKIYVTTERAKIYIQNHPKDFEYSSCYSYPIEASTRESNDQIIVTVDLSPYFTLEKKTQIFTYFDRKFIGLTKFLYVFSDSPIGEEEKIVNAYTFIPNLVDNRTMIVNANPSVCNSGYK